MALLPDIELRKAFEEEAKPVEEAKMPSELKPPEIGVHITTEDIERMKAVASKVGGIVEELKTRFETREERHAMKEIDKLRAEIEKLKAQQVTQKSLDELKAEREALRKELQEMKMAQLKKTI